MASPPFHTMRNEDPGHEDSDQSQRLNSQDKGKGKGPASENSAATEEAIEEATPPPVISKQNEHITFASSAQQNPSNSHEEVYGDNGSTYYSARSRMSFRSVFTRSTGQRSQNGATWLQAFTNTMNSGFGSGAPRSGKYTGVREGREKGGYLPPVVGVGRTGKRPAPVPASMLKALGVKWEEPERYLEYPKLLEGQRFYAISLDSLHRRDGLAVPLIVTKCLEALNLYGLQEERLYGGRMGEWGLKGKELTASRLSESEAMKHLRDQFLSLTTETVGQLNLTNPAAFYNDIKAVARILYRFLEQLPDPLLKGSFYLAFLKADEADPAAQAEQLRAIVTNLPEAHHETLKALIEHFGKLIANWSVNKTNSQNLAEDWAQALLHRGTEFETEPAPLQVRMRIVQAILNNRDMIFRSES